MGTLVELGEGLDGAFENGEIFSCEVDFVDHDVSVEEEGVAGDLMEDLVDVTGYDLRIIDFRELIIPDDPDFKLLLSHLLDLTEVVVLDDVVHCIHCQTKRKVGQRVHVELLDDPYPENEIL